MALTQRILSHYTNAQGLVGIARTQSLWATEFISLNDKTEFTYALCKISKTALSLALECLPFDVVNLAMGKGVLDNIDDKITEEIRNHASSKNGYESLFVTSFALSRNTEQNRDGIGELWAEYAGNRGYCLQFTREHIERTLEFEMQRNSYVALDLLEVSYGIDEKSSEFRNIAEQFSFRLLHQAALALKRYDFVPDITRFEQDSMFERKLLRFCARHKHPRRSYEQEVRIFASPARMGRVHFLTGFALPKRIRERAYGQGKANYIVVGEGSVPGFIPRDIIFGPNTDVEPHFLQGLYPQMPNYRKINESAA
jgi:hypothetical protein